MQEPTTAPLSRKGLEESASALLEAVVRAEVELHALQERCDSLELAISLGHEAVSTAMSLPAESAPAKSTSGNVPEVEAPTPEEIPAAAVAVAAVRTGPAKASAPETPAPIRPPEPLSIRPKHPADTEPVLEPAAESAARPAAATVAAEPPSEPKSDVVSPSLEEQAAALRAVMGSGAQAPAPKTAPAHGNAGVKRPDHAAPTKATPPAKNTPNATVPDTAGEQRPFKPKRSTPLKSRLAGLDVTAAEEESESYSERSAELEQLLRTRDQG